MNLIITLYILTGWLMSFDYIYYDSQKGKQHGLIETGIIMLLFMVLWFPINLVAIYWYALTALYNLITEEEND